MKYMTLAAASLLVLAGCGGGSDAEVTIVVSPTSGVEITGTPSESVTENTLYSFTPSVSMEAVGAVNFSIANKPSWASFNNSDGELTGTPINSDIGVYSNVTITATDDLGTSSIGPFTITVSAASNPDAIEISGTPNASVVENNAYSFTPSITTPATGTAVFSISNKPTWTVFNTSNGALTGTPINSDIGVYSNVTITATDDLGTSSIGPFTITVSAASFIAISGTPNASIDEESAYSFTPIIDTPANGTAVFSISNKPSWASFNTSNGALTGTPDDADVGTDSNITITATDDEGSSSIGPFSITISAINDAPALSDQTKSGLNFSSNVAFTVSASDVDSAASSYVYSVVSNATYGSIVITDHETSSFEYQPSSVTGINGDSFTLELSDGSDTSATATISLSFSDATAPSLTLSPSNGAANVAVDTTFTITSDDPLDTTSITYNASAATCTGTLQISDDNFNNCIGITSAVASNLNRTITITAAADMDSSSEYKMKVTTGVDNLLGVSVASDVTNTFNTAANGLIITEVGETGSIHDMRWFELYNASSAVIDASTYSFKSRSVSILNLVDNGNGSFSYSYYSPSTATFSLPSVNIQPGQYLIVRSQHFINSNPSSDRVVYVYNTDAEDGTYPYWDTDGFIDLIKSGVTEDFVTFGASYTPTTGTQWSGTFATALPSVADQYGHSLARDGSNTDSNTEADWSSNDFATKGGVNDVTCTTDTDADGIPDCSEVSGSTFAGLPLYDWGARTGQKDIFIEVDYMDATNGGAQTADEGIVPRQEALQKVVDSFAAQGIAVHFDVGDLYDQASGIDPVDFDLGGGEEVPFQDAITFSTATSVYDYKLSYMEYARKQIFHYLIFANTQDGNPNGSSGLAELNGNDLMVSLGEWSLSSTNTGETNKLINIQASTLMHELGHNLGLRHGGNEDSNHKPNYFSIMNYTYQVYGLSEIGNNEGDRFYLEYYDDTNAGSPDTDCYVWPLNKSYSTTDFIINYSHGDAAALNLASLNETLGLGQVGSDGVDYNCDGDVIDTTANIGTGTWTDHDDWSNLVLDFQRYSSGDNNGIMLRNLDVNPDSDLMPDKVGHDRTPIAQEYAPPPEFFERLNNL